MCLCPALGGGLFVLLLGGEYSARLLGETRQDSLCELGAPVPVFPDFLQFASAIEVQIFGGNVRTCCLGERDQETSVGGVFKVKWLTELLGKQ